jgi:signal transduction histidine kinase
MKDVTSRATRRQPERALDRHWWGKEIAQGIYRSAVLTGLLSVIPAVSLAVGFFGSQDTLSWSSKLTAPLVVRGLAALGEEALALWWVVVAVGATFVLLGRPLSQAARRLARRWMGVQIEAGYRPVPPLTRLATGFWWNGYAYLKSEGEARRQARLYSRASDPQARRDALWLLVASVTALPVAALSLAGLSGGICVAILPGMLGWGLIMIAAGLALSPAGWRIFGFIAPRFLGPDQRSRLDQRVDELESIRAGLTQTQATELERIERGLHDGAQARLVALGLSMGTAEELIDKNPAEAKVVLATARASATVALDELRSLVRGINPPVLAERGAVDAIRALALDAPVNVTVTSSVPARPEQPIEAAVYFTVAELITNATKHARASQVTVHLGYDSDTLTAIVTDDGIGGATKARGSGLSGIEQRIAAFGGRLDIESPSGGPTLVTVAVPCVLS